MKNQSGLVTLLVVIVISVAALIIAFSASLLGLGDMEMSYIFQRGSETQSLTDGCAEEALYRLKQDHGYTGGVLDLSTGSCIITITEPGGGIDRQITIIGTIQEYNKRIQLDIVFSGDDLVISDWRDLALN